jgi:hypothetical protein
MTIAVMSKTMFAAIRSVSVLCGLELECFDISCPSPLTSGYSLALRITKQVSLPIICNGRFQKPLRKWYRRDRIKSIQRSSGLG